MRRRFLTVAVLLGMAGTGLGATAPAASATSTNCLVVDRNTDTTTSSLQGAVDAAAPGDSLFVKGTCTGSTEIDKNLTIDGHSDSGTKTATLIGDHHSVLTIDSGTSVTLNALIITKGSALFGGGIFNYAGTVTLTGSSITDNHTGEDGGGGIFNDAGTVTLSSSTVSDNSASIFGGGGITNADGGTVTLNGSTVTGNTAGGLPGKPIYGGGGGILNGGTVILNGSTVSHNATGGDGGGIRNDGTVTLSGTSTVHDNTASGEGGGTCNSSSGTLVGAVAGVNIYGNTPDDVFNGVC